MKRKKLLHYIDTGAGNSALVFLHYFGGSSNSWLKVIDQLSNQFRCIAIDLPGFGSSQNNLQNLTIQKCANEVNDVIHHLALKQYVLVGHSMGGKIAMCIASRKPPELASLILIAPSPPTPEPMSDIERKQLLEAYGDRGALIKLVNSITAQPLSNDDIENVLADNFKVAHASWKWWVNIGSAEDISSLMSIEKLPSLIISGEMDPKFSTGFLREEMTRYFYSVTFKQVSATGHLLPVEPPLQIAKLINNFCETIKGCKP